MKSYFAFFILLSFSWAQAESLEPLRPSSEKKQMQVIKDSLRGQSALAADPAIKSASSDGAQLISDSPARKLQEDLDPLGIFLEASPSDSQKAGEAVQ